MDAFWIQVSNPAITGERDPHDGTLAHALQTIFPLRTEYAYVVWNHIHVPIGYKYDVSLLADDVVSLVDALVSSPRDSRTIDWPSNTFAARWALTWEEDTLTIATEWHTTIGGLEPLLNRHPRLNLSRAAFIAEWSELLVLLRKRLLDSGYSPDWFHPLSRLVRVLDRVDMRGELYS